MTGPAASPARIDADLVLEGGGVKGIALVAAITVLEHAGYRFRRVAGVSAGSIIGSLVAAGMPADDLVRVMRSLDYRRLGDRTHLARIPFIGTELSLWWHKGVHSGDYLRDFAAEQLAGCGVHTFADLRDDDPGSSLNPEDRYKLIVHVSDISRARLLRFPWDYRPVFGLDPDDQGVAECLRSSSSIPFFFVPMRLLPAVGGASWLVDGGVMSGFPVEVFDRSDGRPPRWPTVGIKLSPRAPSDAIQHRVRNLVSFGEALIGSLSGWYDTTMDDRPSVAQRTIFVDCFGVQATDLDISEATKRRLYDSGRKAATEWLEAQTGTG